MADNRRHASNEPLDLGKILEEAQTRWLRPNEVCEILRNHQLFKLTPDPPRLPSSGSQFLFDRKALRYFRRDGHSWRKKKDGKTVREAHEKLKAGSVDVLHCYYAHGEDNENFQRRSYWMLDSQLEHIVFVHYREVKEGNKLGIPSLLNANTGAQLGGPQSSSSPLAARVDSPGVTLQASYASSPSTANWTGHTPSSEFEDVDSVDELGTSSLAVNVSCSGTHIAHIRTDDMSGFPCSSGNPGTRFGTSSSSHDCSPSIWSGLQSFNGKLGSINKKNCFDQTNSVKLPDTSFMLENRFSRGYSFFPETNFEALYRDPRAINQEHRKTDNLGHANYFTCDTFAKSAADVFQLTRKKDVQVAHPQFQDVTGFCMPTASRDLSLGVGNDEPRGLAKLDSFGRWMNKEIGVDCDDSLMASDSGNYWNTLDTPNDDKEVSSLSRHMQLDIDSLGPSLSKEQLFSICDFSPDWAYSGVDTKVLVTGKFLSDSNNPVSAKWCCMFGEVEVPAEIVNGNVLRCQVPAHSPGRVPFYITCSNRLACSEVREFEYKKNPPGGTLVPIRTEPEEEMCFQIRFANFLSQRADREVSDFSLDNCDKCNRRAEILSMRTDDEKEWGLIGCNHENPKDALIQKLLQDRFYEWLVCKVHEGDKGPHILDVEGQGVIHLAAALGYGWAMAPIVAAGVSPSFRDAHGRTGLHWAAYFGREETVVTLLRLGVAPGAVDDPTSKFPGGRTAADLASSRGHKGIAGYLAESDLTSHLSTLTCEENVTDSVAATIAAEKAVETVKLQNNVIPEGCVEKPSSLQGLLDAVRKSAQAAALIQAAFRTRSFQHRELTRCSKEDSELPADLVALASLNNKAQKKTHFSDYLHGAAVKIQHKYRGWKGRKDFLKIRNRIVKIQAHVRGHQVRKHYKKVIWSVSIVEKAILRWRRKGPGLRGFRADRAIGSSEALLGKTDEYEFLRLGRRQKVIGVEKALARVQSMVRYPEARDQYMRMVTNFQKLQMDGEGINTVHQTQSLEKV